MHPARIWPYVPGILCNMYICGDQNEVHFRGLSCICIDDYVTSVSWSGNPFSCSYIDFIYPLQVLLISANEIVC